MLSGVIFTPQVISEPFLTSGIQKTRKRVSGHFYRYRCPKILIKGYCLLEHGGDNSNKSPALKQKVIFCIVCIWSPFPTLSVPVPSASVQVINSPVQCKMVSVRERGLKDHALKKEGQSGQFLNNKSAYILDKLMLRAQKLPLQETLIPYPSLRKDLKHQHLRLLLFPSFPLWNVDVSWMNRRVTARRESFSYPNQQIYSNAFARRYFSMRKYFYDINGKNDRDFLPSPILAGFDNSQK